jgi:nitroreductase
MLIMIAAHEMGLATAPLDGFDEPRVKRLVRLPPRRFVVPLVIPIGYAAEIPAPRSRLPLSEFVHVNRWTEHPSEGRRDRRPTDVG